LNLNKQFVDNLRSGKDGLFQAQKTAETENNQMLSWNNMRPQTAASSNGSNLVNQQPFMEPTESFNTRTTLIQNSKKY